MSCNFTLNGATLDCTNHGGIVELGIIPVEDVVSVTGATEEGVAYDEIVGITLATDKKFKKYAFRKGNASFSSSLEKDEKSNTVGVKTDVTLQLNHMSNLLRREMVQLSGGAFYVVVKDNNGKYWFIGYDSYASATTGTGQTGAERTEGNFYSIVLSAETNEYPMTIDEAIWASLF
jgi:hypothetical protein